MTVRLREVCGAVLLSAALVGCTAAPATAPAPPTPAASAPGARVVDYAGMEAAIERSIRSGSLNLTTIEAVMVSVDGHTKVAHYRNGRTPQEALHVWSVTKSVVAALIGVALDEKLIPSLDATLPVLLPRYRDQLTAEQQTITLRQLMSMSAGYPPDDPAPFRNIHLVFESRTDPIPMILTDPRNEPPGELFTYSSRSAHLVSAVLREALARADGAHPRTVLQYAREKLFDPLGIDTRGAREPQVRLSDTRYDLLSRFDWGTDATGLNTACCLLRLRPADLVKLGELYLGGGVWHGRTILPRGWVEQTVAPSPLNPEYGLMWWRVIDHHGHPVWVARGSAGQLIAVVPEHKLVVAVGSVPTDDAGIDGDIWPWIENLVVPALG